MAPKVTSSSNRSSRKPAKPPVVTTSKGRANRSSVSTAKPTTGGTKGSGNARITNAAQRTISGNATVTGGAKPALPPGQRGGALTIRGNNSPVKGKVPVNTQRLLPGSQDVQPAPRPPRPGTTRPPAPTRRESAATRSTQAAKGGTSSGVRVGQPGANGTTARGAQVSRGLTAAIGALGAASDYSNARNRGETRGRSAAQAGAGLAGALGGARAGGMLPGGPLVRGVGSLIGGMLGYSGALGATQGIQEAGKGADQRRDQKNGNGGLSSTGTRVSDTTNNRDYKAAPTGSQTYNNYRNNQISAEQERLKKVGSSSKPESNKNQASSSSNSSSSSRSSSNSSRSVTGKAQNNAPKSGDTTPPGVPAKDSYRDGGKGLYQGSQAYRDSMKAKDANSSGNPLLDNNRKIGKSQATSSSATSAPGGIGPTVSDQQLNQMRIKKDQEKKRVRRRNEY